jgi:hypothetical protein
MTKHTQEDDEVDMAPPKHPYNPGYSYGNVLSTIGIIGGGVLVFVAMHVTSARADEKIIALQKEFDYQKELVSDNLETINKKIESIDNKANNMAEKQAMLLANIELLMRSQGVRPVGVRNEN